MDKVKRRTFGYQSKPVTPPTPEQKQKLGEEERKAIQYIRRVMSTPMGDWTINRKWRVG